jgi:hypothetical protein
MFHKEIQRKMCVYLLFSVNNNKNEKVPELCEKGKRNSEEIFFIFLDLEKEYYGWSGFYASFFILSKSLSLSEGTKINQRALACLRVQWGGVGKMGRSLAMTQCDMCYISVMVKELRYIEVMTFKPDLDLRCLQSRKHF